MNATLSLQPPSLLPPSALVIPVRYVAGGEIVQTTSTELNVDSIHVRALNPPQPGRIIGLQLYFPALREAASPISVVAARTAGTNSGFWAEFAGNDGSKDRIAALLDRHRDAAQRTCRRFPTGLAASIRQRGAPEHHGQVTNISQTGAFIRLDQTPPKYAVVELDIAFPGDSMPHTVMAFVVHEAPCRGVGVQFIGGTDEFREELDRHLAELAR
jgi:PilZ domain